MEGGDTEVLGEHICRRDKDIKRCPLLCIGKYMTYTKEKMCDGSGVNKINIVEMYVEAIK